MPVFQVSSTQRRVPSPAALPRRFRRQRILIIGCGDVGLRVARVLAPHSQVLALTSSLQRLPALRASAIKPLQGNLDAPLTLRRLAGIANRIIHLAPPPGHGEDDPRTAALLRALHRAHAPKALVYVSTTGVYGDCGGQVVTETRVLNAQSDRAKRRISAEKSVRRYARQRGVKGSILRVPGIYAADREGGTPRHRLLRASPALQPADDVYTNHIHADDLARACVAALWRGRALRVYNVSDDTCLKMGDYLDAAADLYGLPRPPRVSRAQAQAVLSPMQFSFMCESRRLDNTRLKQELRLCLRYATVWQGLP